MQHFYTFLKGAAHSQDRELLALKDHKTRFQAHYFKVYATLEKAGPTGLFSPRCVPAQSQPLAFLRF